MSNFQEYMERQALTREASARLDHASARLELARIQERLAEVKSQHQPFAKLLEAPLSERDRLYAAAFYVVVGRGFITPDEGKTE